MLPRQHVYGQWPASGEIDILESRGNLQLMKDGVNIGVEQVENIVKSNYFQYFTTQGF